MSDSMNGRERIFSAVTMSGLPDHLPVVPLLLTRGIREGGITCDVAQVNPEAMAGAKMKATERFGGDAIIAGTDLFNPVENLGAEMDYLPYAQPSLVEHPCPTKEQFYRVRDEYYANGFDPSKGRVTNVAREIQIFIENGYKDTHVIVAPVGGPVTTAELMTGSSEFFSYMAEDPEYAQEVLELATEVVKNVARVYFEAGVDAINLLDPFASCDVLSPELFREFALPGQKEVFRYIAEDVGGVGMTHVCAYIEPILEDLAGSGAANVNGDFYPGIDEAKRAIGGSISLMGSVSPFSTLLTGTPDDVAAEVKKLAAEVGYNGGFIAMPGCDIDWTIPAENLDALVQTCASIQYPMDVTALGNLRDIFLPGHPNHRGTRVSSAESVPEVLGVNEAADSPEEEVYQGLIRAIMDYDGDAAVEWTQRGLDLGLTPQQIAFDGLSVGMKLIGDMYERNERFVSDMLKASKTMDQAMTVLTPLLEASGSDNGPTGTVVMGLVRGNTQDIGKNLVCLMLRANGFEVIDLGKNTKPEEFLAAAQDHDAVAIGMSIMTNSSAVYVEKTIKLLEERGERDQYLLMFGGAAANTELAEKFGIAYGADANAAVALVTDHVIETAA
ncbi:MAG: hypothetical protein BMS9Abin20_1170 [Acidimicrobiia bacterium]|nr:MAG: hypothetical protein BMS9Abin20_1170 [Acidimicrobiia bacterium]